MLFSPERNGWLNSQVLYAAHLNSYPFSVHSDLLQQYIIGRDVLFFDLYNMHLNIIIDNYNENDQNVYLRSNFIVLF